MFSSLTIRNSLSLWQLIIMLKFVFFFGVLEELKLSLRLALNPKLVGMFMQ